MAVLYFAYGSNMSSARMRRRVHSARPVGCARLRDHRLRLNKPGRDGSAKANVETSRGAEVWGVLYELDSAGLEQLDRFEPGYERRRLRVGDGGSGEAVRAEVYVARRVVEDLAPLPAYTRLMLEAAREHRLPPSYRRRLERLAAGGAPASTSRSPSSRSAPRPGMERGPRSA